MTTNKIWVTFRKQGFHCFPEAPEAVSYLRDRHRHQFHFQVGIEVFHDDREIEFHLFQNLLARSFDKEPVEFGSKSCEHIARDIYDLIQMEYSDRRLEVTVSEDGENGFTLSDF